VGYKKIYKIRDLLPISCYISQTIQDIAIVTMEDEQELARASLRILKWGVQSMASGSEPENFLSVPPIRGVQNSTRAINLGVHATA